MASNLSSIGFRFGSETSFMDVIPPLADDCVEMLACNVGDYAIWRSVTGAELWFHLAHPDGGDRDVLGLTPFYEGRSRLRAHVDTIRQRDDDNAFEGLWQVRLHDAQDERNELIVEVAAIDYAAHVTQPTPFECELRLCGFAQRLTVVQGADAASDTRTPSSFFGRIGEHQCLTNEITGREFHWFLIDHPAGKVDVVADPAIVDGDLVEGAWAHIECRYFGRMLSEVQPDH